MSTDRNIFAHTAHQLTLQAVALKDFRRATNGCTTADEFRAALGDQIADYESRLALNASVGFALAGAPA